MVSLKRMDICLPFYLIMSFHVSVLTKVQIAFKTMPVLRLENLRGKRARHHTVAASNNSDNTPRSLYYCMFAPHTVWSQAGLPDWSFLGQISEICFKLVGLNGFSWPFGLISGWLTLEMGFGLLALFYVEIGAYEGKYCHSIFFGNIFAHVCDKCYIRRPHSDK